MADTGFQDRILEGTALLEQITHRLHQISDMAPVPPEGRRVALSVSVLEALALIESLRHSFTNLLVENNQWES